MSNLRGRMFDVLRDPSGHLSGRIKGFGETLEEGYFEPGTIVCESSMHKKQPKTYRVVGRKLRPQKIVEIEGAFV